MDNIYRRKICEIEALYELESMTKDLFAEGPEDSNLYNLFLERNNILDAQVYPVDMIDFSDTNTIELKSNKDKVIYLAEVIYKKFEKSLPNILCVIDRDFDTVDDTFINNPYLAYTDFANLEMYLFNNDSIDKFLKIGLKNFPLTSVEVINKLQPALIDLYSLRYARSKIDKSLKLPKLDKVFKIKSGDLFYDKDAYMSKLLKNNGCPEKKDELKKEINVVNSRCEDLHEPRCFIHGKDFFELFFILIKKIKNTYNFNHNSFVRSFFASIEIDTLKQYDLFLTLEKKYEN